MYNELVFTEALEQVEAIMATHNADEIGDRIERLAQYPDLAMSAMMILVFKAKGVDTSHFNGVELANTQPNIRDLILPPGVNLNG